MRPPRGKAQAKIHPVPFRSQDLKLLSRQILLLPASWRSGQHAWVAEAGLRQGMTTGVLALVWPRASCVTLGKSQSLSGPLLILLQMSVRCNE